jgi:hypothetical protein
MYGHLTVDVRTFNIFTIKSYKNEKLYIIFYA